MIEKEIHYKGRYANEDHEHHVKDLFAPGAGVGQEARQHNADNKEDEGNGVGRSPIQVAHVNENHEGNGNVRDHRDEAAFSPQKSVQQFPQHLAFDERLRSVPMNKNRMFLRRTDDEDITGRLFCYSAYLWKSDVMAYSGSDQINHQSCMHCGAKMQSYFNAPSSVCHFELFKWRAQGYVLK